MSVSLMVVRSPVGVIRGGERGGPRAIQSPFWHLPVTHQQPPPHRRLLQPCLQHRMEPTTTHTSLLQSSHRSTNASYPPQRPSSSTQFQSQSPLHSALYPSRPSPRPIAHLSPRLCHPHPSSTLQRHFQTLKRGLLVRADVRVPSHSPA